MCTSTLKNLHRILCFYAARRFCTNVGFWCYRENMLVFHFIDSKHVATPVCTRLFSIKSAAKHLASCTWGIIWVIVNRTPFQFCSKTSLAQRWGQVTLTPWTILMSMMLVISQKEEHDGKPADQAEKMFHQLSGTGVQLRAVSLDTFGDRFLKYIEHHRTS